MGLERDLVYELGEVCVCVCVCVGGGKGDGDGRGLNVGGGTGLNPFVEHPKGPIASTQLFNIPKQVALADLHTTA